MRRFRVPTARADGVSAAVASSLGGGDLVDQSLDRLESDLAHRVVAIERLAERVRVGDEEVPQSPK